jgi:hypothetical protein
MGLKPDFLHDGKVLSCNLLRIGATWPRPLISAVLSVQGASGSEVPGANIEAEAQRTAKGIANQLKPCFASKGWMIVQ